MFFFAVYLQPTLHISDMSQIGFLTLTHKS